MAAKKVIAAVAGALVMAASQNVFAQVGGLSNALGGAGGLLGKTQSGGNMKANAQQFALCMSAGTYHLVTALARMEAAVGHEDNAKALAAQADIIKSAGASTTADQYTKTYQMVDQSNIDRDELAKVPEAQGRVEFAQSSLHLTVGALEDKKAITLAQALVSYQPTAQDAMNGSFLSMVNVARVAVSVLPGHVQKTSTWMGYLGDYFSSHNITPPTDDEKKKVAAADLPPDQANALFANK